MKKIFKFIVPVFIISLIIYSCNENIDLDTLNDDTITTIFERTSETSIPSNNGVFPDVMKVEEIGKNTDIGKNLILEINSIKNYDLDFSKIERITFSSAKYYSYSIPFKSGKSILNVVTNNSSISIVISKQITLENGNKKFIVNNYENQPLMSLEQNTENKIGNRTQFKNVGKSFVTKSIFPLVENNYLAKGSGCAGLRSFSGCMQCMFDECLATWQCTALMAIYPVQTIGFAAGVCALDTVVNN
jgi:hypothetical protein